MKIPTILKGDDAGAITLALDSSHSYDGATLVVAYQGATKTFTGLAAGGTVSLVYNHVETAAFRLGCYPMEARLIGAGGSIETVSNAEWRIKVTDIVSEVNCGGSFAVVPGAASVPVTDVKELGERYKLTDLAAKINEVCRILAQRTAPVSGPSAGPFGAVALALLFSLGAFAANVQTARLDDMYNDERVVTNVTFEGLATPGAVSNIVTKAYVEDLGITADFSTNNTELVETIEATAPAPGDYAAVSNAAVHAAITNALQDAELESLSDSVSTLSNTKLDKTGGTVVGTLGVAGPELPELTVFEVVPSADGSAPTMRFSHAPGVVGLRWKIAQTSDGHDNVVMEASNEQGESRRIELPFAAGTLTLTSDIPHVHAWALEAQKPTYTASEVGATTPADVTAAIREQSLGGIWDAELEVWWTPRMKNGCLTYEATTNVNLNAEN